MPSGIRGIKIDDQADDRERLHLDFPDAEAPDLDQARQRLRPAYDQASRVVFQIGPIVRDKPRKRQKTLCGRDQKVPCKP